MPRPDRSPERRAELIPVVAKAFSELGYRRATTAELARRCGVQETTLYRLWPDKKSMFLAAITHVVESSTRTWSDTAAREGAGSAAQKVLAYEAEHHGELGLYRILFAGLGETDDPEIRTALGAAYERVAAWIQQRIDEHRGDAPDRDDRERLKARTAAWAAVGLGTVINIGRELGLLDADQRRRLLADVGALLLDG